MANFLEKNLKELTIFMVYSPQKTGKVGYQMTWGIKIQRDNSDCNFSTQKIYQM